MSREETIQILRPPGLSGVEVVDIRRSTQRWAAYQKTWDLCLVTEGAAQWRYRGRSMHTPTGALRLKEPGERFSTEQVDAPTSLAILQLDPARLAELLDALPASRRHFGELQLEQGAHALPRLRALMGRLRATDAALLDREEALAELIQDFFAPNMEAVAPGTRARPTRAMRRVRDYIEAHYEESFSLGTLAQLCGLHEVYLVRAFRQCYGLPPHALQNELRIQAARRALTSGAHGATLAAQLGFHDQSHFIRHFKRIVGVTPGEYARAG